MKILFVNPVVREEDVPRHVPYGMAILANIARDLGYSVQVYDANAWRKSDKILESVLKADSWDIICFGGLTTTYKYIKKISTYAARFSPSAKQILGGGVLTSMPRDIMSWLPSVDVGVIGEAYSTFPELLRFFSGELDIDIGDIKGIIYKSGNNLLMTDVRPNIENIDSIPWPAWDLFPLEEVYFKNSSSLFSEEAFESKRRIDINASYGCHLVCRYCWHLGTTGDMITTGESASDRDVAFTYGRNIRYHSPDYIIRMVKYLKEKYNVDQVTFLDENLMTVDVFSGRTWLKELCDKWIEAGLQPESRKNGDNNGQIVAGTGVFWSGTSHAALHNPEILSEMYRAGCTHLVYGLETFDKYVLKRLGKGSTPEKNESSVRICMESGIKPIPNIIIGFPEESFDSIRATIEALLRLGIHAKPHFATAYPGSEWYSKYKNAILDQYGGDLERYIMDLGDASSITASISEQFSPYELMGLQEIVYRRDLRLLDIAEKHWKKRTGGAKYVIQPNVPQNFIPSKISTPLGG
jgi:anaerobic magnesium-protoporphyrin IX monomethyl ester cyclase